MARQLGVQVGWGPLPAGSDDIKGTAASTTRNFMAVSMGGGVGWNGVRCRCPPTQQCGGKRRSSQKWRDQFRSLEYEVRWKRRDVL
jgi:hypothetical protein